MRSPVHRGRAVDCIVARAGEGIMRSSAVACRGALPPARSVACDDHRAAHGPVGRGPVEVLEEHDA